MRCLRIYASPDGESHFDEVDIPTVTRPIFPGAAPFELSAQYPASRIRFTRIPAAMHEVGYHTVPHRILTVRLDGSVEYRQVQAAGFVLVEDTHGKGHISRHSAEPQTVIWMALPDSLDPPPG
jgi:hypothetical protein